MRTRLTELLGVRVPIVQAPMGWIARAPLASAVANAGAVGIIETSSGELDVIRDEIRRMRELTDGVWGVNIAQLFVADPDEMVDFVVANEVGFVTTSAGDPRALVPRLKDAGITVFHVVPSVRTAQRAVDAGVDGLVVEGVEGGGFKNPDGASTMVLIPEVRARFDVPIVAAGGIVDGPSMAAALALGADGVQMGTRMVATVESPVHDNWKQAIVAASETDTVMVNRHHRPAMRALRTERTGTAERDGVAVRLDRSAMMELYFGGDLEAAVAMAGQVAGRIGRVEPVAEVIRRTWDDCLEVLRRLGSAAG